MFLTHIPEPEVSAITAVRWVARRLNRRDVLDARAELFVIHRPPEHIHSDHGPEFIAKAVRDWLERIGVRTLYIEPGSPWENGYNESFPLSRPESASTQQSIAGTRPRASLAGSDSDIPKD